MKEKNSDNKETKKNEFKGYAIKRIAVGILLTFAALWIFGTLLGFFDKSDPVHVALTHDSRDTAADHTAMPPTHGGAEHATEKSSDPAHPAATGLEPEKRDEESHDTLKVAATPHAPAPEATGGHGAAEVEGKSSTDAHGAPVEKDTTADHATRQTDASGHAAQEADPHQPATGADAHQPAPSGHGVSADAAVHDEPTGVAFINATIKPMEYELTERFWGWRPNDILDFTDNVNNFQLGVLEVTRRTVVALAERISRTGTTASFDRNLENAMNWFMIKADRYWFPSPESKYNAGLKELAIYRENLRKGAANFHTRTDNLIPLLKSYENLLGSCDENLVKAKEHDGSAVSYFSSDDYFYYAQGVASAMHSVLEAVHSDFHTIIESRGGAEVLHHAILSCHHAMEIHPLLITNNGPSGILANHRANMAAPISHARFYIGLLIKTLST